jgi:hypothetical protein
MVEKLKGCRRQVLIRPVAKVHEELQRRFRVSKEVNYTSFSGVDTFDYFDLVAVNKRKIWPTSMSSESLENVLG